MTYLLDVNVLIALIDTVHIHHEAAHQWFTAKTDWATCAITENGLLRIVGNPGYPSTPGPPSIVATYLTDLKRRPGHRFWSESISLLDNSRFETRMLSTSAQLTDNYLLGLAVRYGGQLATFDRRMSTSAVINSKSAFYIIGN